MRNTPRHFYEFGTFRVDAERHRLFSDGELLPLPPKAIEALVVFVQHPGKLLEREALMQAVWADTIVEDANLTVAISQLRKALGKKSDSGEYIETIPRAGYRFLGEVREVTEHPAPLVVEKHTLAQTVIEEEFLPSEPTAPVQVIESSPKAVGFSAVYRKAGPLLAAGIVFAILGGGILYLRRTDQPVSVAAAPVPIRSIAVLPLKNLSNDLENSFSLGLTDSLITGLGQLNRLTVRPFSAVEKFNASHKDAVTFGQDLKTDAVLEGTIQMIGDRVKVSLRLVDVKTGKQLWTDNFEETASDLLKLQDVISGRVAQVLLIKLKHEEELLLSKSATTNAEAYRLYLIGREKWMKREWDRDCLAFYRKAIELDRNFALPYLGIADLYAFTYETKLAEDALAKTIELDPTLHEAYATRGFLQMFHRWNWQGAESSFRHAIELAPNSSKAHHWYGVYLSIRGRLDEAISEMEKALELDPTALVIMTDLAELHYFKSDYERAESELEKVLTIDPSFLNARMHLVKVRYKRGASYFMEDAEFLVFWQKLRRSETPPREYDTSRLEELLAKKDEQALQKESEESLLKDLKTEPAAYLALARQYLLTGEKEKSLRALEKARAAKIFTMPFVAVDPLWENVRSEPGFQEILRRMNL